MLRPRERLPFLHKGKNFKHNNASWNLRNCMAVSPNLQNIYSHMYSYISVSISIYHNLEVLTVGKTDTHPWPSHRSSHSRVLTKMLRTRAGQWQGKCHLLPSEWLSGTKAPAWAQAALHVSCNGISKLLSSVKMAKYPPMCTYRCRPQDFMVWRPLQPLCKGPCSLLSQLQGRAPRVLSVTFGSPVQPLGAGALLGNEL